MRHLLLPTALLLVTCARSPASPSPMRGYDESIRFPKTLPAGGIPIAGSNERLLLDGETIQAIMVAAKDFIPPSSSGINCFTKPSDFFCGVFREGDIIFVSISPNYFSCERGPAPLDWGAKYAISTDGRILRRVDNEEPDEPSPSPPDAGGSDDGGYSRTGELSDFAHVFSAPGDDPPFFTRPEWRAQHWPHAGPSDGGTPDGGVPDGGLRADGGPPAIPPK